MRKKSVRKTDSCKRGETIDQTTTENPLGTNSPEEQARDANNRGFQDQYNLYL